MKIEDIQNHLLIFQGDDKKREDDPDDEKEKEEELANLEGKKEKDTNRQMMKTGQCKMNLNQEDVKNNKELSLIHI